MEFNRIDHKDIVGWGVDADKSVRPNYPMWKPVSQKVTGAHWDVPEQQPNFKDFYSMERPSTTHVFGTTVPPKGLSGLIRKFSFAKFSEGHFEHWMLLILADRIQVFEGIIDDLMHGTVPRLLQERGWEVDKKFKTRRYKKVMTLGALAIIAPIVFLALKKDNGPAS